MTSRIWRQILAFSKMGYLVLLIEKTFHKDLRTKTSFEICLSSEKTLRFKI